MIVDTSSWMTQPLRSLSKSWKASRIFFFVSTYQFSSRASAAMLPNAVMGVKVDSTLTVQSE